MNRVSPLFHKMKTVNAPLPFAIPSETKHAVQSSNVPQDTLRSGEPSFSCLQNPPPEVLWEKVINRSEIEVQILKYNRDSFRVTADSPYGHGIIHDKLTFTGLSPAASGLLHGVIPDNWPTSDDHLQSFLSSFTIPETEQNSPPISTTLSTDDVSRSFKQWREKTTTSPSGRHLGHYKALISNPTLLNCSPNFSMSPSTKASHSNAGARPSTS
jgi:hypothetical protein